MNFKQPACKRIAHAFHERKALGAGKPRSAHQVGAVDLSLQLQEQLRSTLNLVDEKRQRMAAEKSPGRIFRKFSFLRIVQRYIRARSFREMAQKRAFSNLTHAGCQQCLEALTKRRDFFFYRSREVHPALLAEQANAPLSEPLPACIYKFFTYDIRIFSNTHV